jgi:hypothetical protein
MVSRSRRQLASGSAHRQPETYRHDRTPPPGRLILTPRLTWTTRPVPLIGWVWRLRRDCGARPATRPRRSESVSPSRNTALQKGADDDRRIARDRSRWLAPRELDTAASVVPDRPERMTRDRLNPALRRRCRRRTPPEAPVTREVAGSSPVAPASIEAAVSRRQQEPRVGRSAGCTTRSEATVEAVPQLLYVHLNEGDPPPLPGVGHGDARSARHNRGV